MCGILFTNDPCITKDDFIRALHLMKHRGPDIVGCYASHKECQLGHNRLKIVDLDDRSNQPFYSHDGRYVIVYNGEVYNFRELSAKYGIEQRTTGDTEVILELYTRFGPKMLDWLNGMFAFVILDTLSGDIFVARDRLGVKPLYFARKGEKLTIASEITSILELSGSKEFDPIGLRQYQKLRTFFNGRTAYAGIEMFAPGHYMLSGRISRYWKLPDGEQDPPTDDELRELIESAVALRCIADVPIGSYLSGGIDSTIVAGLASKPHTWTVGFADNNEFEWARLASAKFNSIHSEVLMDREEFVSLAKKMIKQRKEPLSVPNEVLLYKMTQRVKEYNTVVLSGEGADELFFGYDRIFRWAANNRWSLKDFDKLYSYGSNDDLEIVEDAVSPFMCLGQTIDIVAAFFQTAHLHGLLRRLDNATMLSSVEARVPFVDYRLVERMAGVSFNYRMANGAVKAPLKRIFCNLVPKEILEREKVGFPVRVELLPLGDDVSGKTSMDKWLKFNLKELVGNLLPEELEST
jgi:asparagine synthase (glutamine-hydrolysing)